MSVTCYSASYVSQTRDRKRFMISEVAADWHELMIPQCTMRPPIARVSEQLDPRFAASRHTGSAIQHLCILGRYGAIQIVLLLLL